ncbi:MAG: HAD family hydrolase [Fibrobacter sp.]|jgi:putative hydrolase of the HAD superfamily|nr:HAD family hydrolase [Fibrobacter sp.]
MKLRAVLFDLYGTLFSYGNMSRAFLLWHQEIAKELRKFGIEKSIPEIKELCRTFFSRPIDSLPGYTDYEERLGLLFKECGADISKETLKNFAAYSMDGWQTEISLHPEAMELLTALKAQGVLLGIVTNFMHHPHIYKTLRENEISHFFDAIVVSSEVRLKKPHREIFDFALKQLNATAAETLFAGDDPEKDIRGAQNAGMQTFTAASGKPLKPILKLLEEP